MYEKTLLSLLALCACGVVAAASYSDGHEAAGSLGAPARIALEPVDVFARITQTTVGNEDDRGCCIVDTQEGPKCAYTNRAYCMSKAAEVSKDSGSAASYRFSVDQSCSLQPECASQE